MDGVDFFCGAGGSSTGLKKAGVQMRMAVNHWPLAIETHASNHPETDHDCTDIRLAHPSRYPKTDFFWASPECTNHSRAKGRQRKNLGQMDLWGNARIDPAEERSRATMREVVEFAEYHRNPIVIVENVVDIRYWTHYEDWLQSMVNLGYNFKTLYLNSMFFGAPQSRDRWYTVFWLRGNKAPDLDFRPEANCSKHGQIRAVQAWKKPESPWGRYGKRHQYLYRCPHCGEEVVPGFRPAYDVIDWSLPVQRIGDRKAPLKEQTRERILAGLRKFSHRPIVVDLAYNHADTGKVKGLDDALPTQTARQTLALVIPFLIHYYTRSGAYSSIREELPTVTPDPRFGLVVPPFISVQRTSQPPTSIDDPLLTVVGGAQHHMLVIPAFVMSYYGSSPTYAALDEPLPALRTVSHEALVIPSPEELYEDCGFRMLEPHELKLAMTFPEDYVILGNKRDQTRQIGNAVVVETAAAIAERCVASLSA